jgi:hypothetical protein
MWVESNQRSIVEEGNKHLQFSAEDRFFKKAALEVAEEVSKSSASMPVFIQRFWPHYFEKLTNNGQPAPKLSIRQEEGCLVAVITSFEEVPIDKPVSCRRL